ncbi:tobamovirus multiplication protein 1 isoform X2 [Triticum aestivum]|uniref:tobamovirus multiplication protein 1 isoform X2 n=1 Tax=Triticum aestivum TaxID=4565 RepID=UPI001D01C7A9|nr:tobamovirus multiplication protein 1-like isoform X2 [Triticum aestivum]
MSRYYAPFRGAASGDGGGCLPLPIIAAEAALAVVDAAIAATAFVQLARIHRHNQQHGWTRQKIFHFMIGLCNIVFLAYFVSTVIATCEKWVCWVHGCGFVLMASPQILLLASFLLLLSFWVDLCHQTNDEDEDDVRSHQEALLDRTKTKPGTRPTDARRKCFPGIQLGSRQKFVILVLVLSFIVMLAFAILIWVGRGENPIDSSLLKKVASLAAVSLICFSSSAILALVTNIPVLLYWYSTEAEIIKNAVILFLYYLIGSSVPSGFVLWVMRDMPQRPTVERPTQSRVVTLFRDRPSPTQDPQWRAAVTSSNKALKSSPI